MHHVPETEPAEMPCPVKKRRTGEQKTLHISDEEYQEGWRLACCSKISADVNVLVPDIASAYKSRMKVADLSSKEEIAILKMPNEMWNLLA